jgi:hypothetical protein
MHGSMHSHLFAMNDWKIFKKFRITSFKKLSMLISPVYSWNDSTVLYHGLCPIWFVYVVVRIVKNCSILRCKDLILSLSLSLSLYIYIYWYIKKLLVDLAYVSIFLYFIKLLLYWKIACFHLILMFFTLLCIILLASWLNFGLFLVHN